MGKKGSHDAIKSMQDNGAKDYGNKGKSQNTSGGNDGDGSDKSHRSRASARNTAGSTGVGTRE